MRPKAIQLYGFHIAALANILIGIVLWLVYRSPIYPLREWSIHHFFHYSTVISFFLFAILLYDYFIDKNIPYSTRSLICFLKKHLLNLATIWLATTAIISFEITITIHTNIKQLIPFLNTFRYDTMFNSIDQWIYFGTNLPLYLASNHNSYEINELFDSLYRYWFLTIPAATSYFIYYKSRDACDSFLSALIYLHGLGIIVGLCFPSFGPFYMYKNFFPAEGMPFCRSTQIILQTISDSVSLEAVKSGKHLFYGYGLMAMPSLHVSVCWLYVVYFWNEHRWLRSLSVVYLVVIFLGSMMSGWHYSLDGYAAVPLVALSVYLARLTQHLAQNINSVIQNHPRLANTCA